MLRTQGFTPDTPGCLGLTLFLSRVACGQLAKNLLISLGADSGMTLIPVFVSILAFIPLDQHVSLPSSPSVGCWAIAVRAKGRHRD